ncbi:adenosylcobalamin-dependent ribonucleoside-diphosphate reductase [Arhodomonas sp. AD133]|uniref:adenosylcobalamin-dependent ribonucleoside-diphosphate reductase n=1 Tax=Arhodomonas sp. AD133 TaxID=3415009 RepID=UPI003EB6E5EC
MADWFGGEPTGITREIWDSRYRLRCGRNCIDADIHDTWRRVSRTAAGVEPAQRREQWSQRFYEVLARGRFLPGGRILAGAGSPGSVTLFNCFVMGVIDDSLAGIFDALRDSALTMQQGGGVGHDFSTLRPRGCVARTASTVSSGPVSFMHVWDAMCATIVSTGARRGAMMATLRCDHPDIEEFVDAKRETGRLTRFNLSVQVTDAFIEAVRADAAWPLVFPDDRIDRHGGTGEYVLREWTGRASGVRCRVLRRVSARTLWHRILRAAYDTGEPGVLFIDRINATNNLGYCEHITATNPCGELPLPPYGACDLGSLNLVRFVRKPFGPGASFDWRALGETAAVATRLLDNVIDSSAFPLPAQAERARASRRVGLGFTGLADTLAMLGLHYDSPAARRMAAAVAHAACVSAYRSSVALAREKGEFPQLERSRYLAAPFVARLPADIRAGIHAYGIRNSHLTAIAPTGTISLLAGNVSTGIEPIYQLEHERAVRTRGGGHSRVHCLRDFAYALWCEHHDPERPPPSLVDALRLSPGAHLAMQAAVQQWVDNAIAKTVNVAGDCSFGTFRKLYDDAYDLGLKGCTVFRPNPVTAAVLTPARGARRDMALHCCGPDREPD